MRFTRLVPRRHPLLVRHGQANVLAAAPPPSVTRQVVTRIPTAHGLFNVAAFSWSGDSPPKEHLALIHGELDALAAAPSLLCRVHSECLTGEVLGSRLCDCGEQLERSMAQVARENGIVLYLRQEGRGIGLVEKLRAYNLQRQGYDTVEANRLLGYGDDERDFSVAALMLQDLGLGHSPVRLITNNPLKVESLKACGVDVLERVPLIPLDVSEHNAPYLNTKAARMGHFLEQQPVQQPQPAAAGDLIIE
jgi:3,4-dihydroxy 2-butanone 4-phosphate synthase/GTP cyclohydrolase II